MELKKYRIIILLLSFLVISCRSTRNLVLNIPPDYPATPFLEDIKINKKSLSEKNIGKSGFISFYCKNIITEEFIEIGYFDDAEYMYGFILQDGKDSGEITFFDMDSWNLHWFWGPENQYYIHLSLVESLVRYYDLSISTEKVQKVFSIEKYRANQKWHKLKKKEIF